MILSKAYGETKSSNWRIGADDAKAPIATCGYFILNQAASTAKTQFHFRLWSKLGRKIQQLQASFS